MSEQPFWPHQLRAISLAEDAIREGHRSIVVTTPTGGGKSRTFTEIARRAAAKGRRTGILTNRRILTGQASSTLAAHDVDHGVMAAGYAPDLQADVQIMSTQTIAARCFKSGRWELPELDLLVIDEGHAHTGETGTRIVTHYKQNGAVVLLFTATPVGLGFSHEVNGQSEQFATKLVTAGTPSELRRCGALVPCDVYAPDEPDMRGIKLRADGEYSGEQAARRAMETLVFGNVFDRWADLNPFREPTLLWAPGVDESRWFVEQFQERGIAAAHLDGETPQDERERFFADSKAGELPILCSCGVLREGVDLPWIRHGILIQPCGALSTFLQIVGRLLRAYPGKTRAVLQDHCLDEQTQVLTRRGFLGRTEITDADEVAGFDLQTGEISWQPILERIDRPRLDGEEVLQAIGPSCDLRITANHRLVFKKRTSDSANVARWPTEWTLGRADVLAESRVRFRVPVSGWQEAPGVPLTNDELRFIGWFVTDGCMERGRTVVISQAAHQPQLHDLVACLAGCGFDYIRREHRTKGRFSQRPQLVFRIPKGTCPARPRSGWVLLGPYLDKNLSPLLENATAAQFDVLLHAIHLGNGHKDRLPGSYRIVTGNRTFADRLQSLAVRRGYRCNISTHAPHPPGRKPKYVLNLKKMNALTLHGARPVGGQTSLRPSLIVPGERVWCVSNPLQTLVIRRNDKVLIVGNSGAWHRHGSPNADREWSLDEDDRSITRRVKAARENGEVSQPICCPKCGGVRKAGPACPYCGHRHVRSVRSVRMTDGRLVRMVGDVVKRKKKVSEEQKVWNSCLYAAAARQRTLAQAAGDYRRRTGKALPFGLENAPAPNSLDWQRPAAEVYPWLNRRRSKTPG